jgi:hypothetical protein
MDATSLACRISGAAIGAVVAASFLAGCRNSPTSQPLSANLGPTPESRTDGILGCGPGCAQRLAGVEARFVLEESTSDTSTPEVAATETESTGLADLTSFSFGVWMSRLLAPTLDESDSLGFGESAS